MRRLFAVGGLVAGALAVVAYLRRGASRRRERVDLYYGDGSMVSLADASPDAERLLSLGRETLRAARPPS
jgi:class 3 adenylate cyclase